MKLVDVIKRTFAIRKKPEPDTRYCRSL